MRLMYFVVALLLVVGIAWAETTETDDVEQKPTKLTSCIPLYCRKSCKHQDYYEGHCVEGLCQCRNKWKLSPQLAPAP